jgi:hypothetical protein
MFIANKLQDFQRLFIDRLDAMLDAEELGAFILVLANSMQDASTRSRLDARLLQVYARHCNNIKDKAVEDAADDVAVFEQLMHSGIDSFTAWHRTEKQPWLQFYNPLRALRPARASAERVEAITRAFSQHAFHFNKPFLQPEIFWQGDISGAGISCRCTVLYNKFPFLPYHFILVPDAEKNLPQFLHQHYHQLVWELCRDNNAALPGIGFGYNSIGACASVNHLHFQGFVYAAELPIEHARWLHNDGDEKYPMQCKVFDDVAASWQAIQQMHAGNQPYNLLYRAGRCYVLRRQMQGSAEVHTRMAGAGWIEACGVFSEAASDAIEQLSAQRLAADIQSLSV